MMFCLKSRELLKEIRYGMNFEVAIPEDFLDPKLKLLFVQDYTTNLERANSTLSLSIWLGS